MAIFKSFDPVMAIAGPARAAVSAAATPPIAPTADPTDMDDVMTAAFIWAAGLVQVGATNGGISMTASWAENELSHDLSDGAFKSVVTATNFTIDMALTDLGDLSKMQLAWPQVGTSAAIVGPPAGRKAGLGAVTSVPHRSLAVVWLDPALNKKRAYWFREVAPTAGDKAVALNEQLSTAPYQLRAYKNTAAPVGAEFGYILEDDGFGGISNS